MSRIHRTVVITKMTPPMTDGISGNTVVPMTISVIPTALTSGISDGPGRWISSPTGGAWRAGIAHAWT